MTLALAGSAVAGAGLYVTSVPTPELRPAPATTVLQYTDGSVLARIGPFDATPLQPEEFHPVLKQAAVAAEDPDFWTDGTGPITRSVVRQGTDTVASSTVAKARIAVQAWKLDRAYTKDEILAYYLNATPFGRQTYGVEAAARVYFGKTARHDVAPEQTLTTAEAMFLLALVRQPYPDPNNSIGSPGFDPAAGQLARQNSQRRWTEIRDGMVALKYLTPEEAAGLAYPEPLPPIAGPNPQKAALGAPIGLVVNHVLDELTHSPDSPFESMTWDYLANGGFTIVTTIEPRVQQLLEETADETVSGSPLNGQPSNLQAAGVVVEPGTGRVLAYYGGHDGQGADYAGFYKDEAGEAVGLGRYPPGGSFLPFTLAAALKGGMSLHSRWAWNPHSQQGRPANNPILNVGACATDVVPRTGGCTLLESFASSLNVPMYDVTVSVTPAKVLEMARDAGIDTMWTDDRARQDLSAVADMTQFSPSKFDITLGIGQYPVTVLDQANAMATFAAGGLRADAHFVRTVTKGGDTVFGEALPNPTEERVLTPEQLADLTYAMTWLGPGALRSDIAIKTGVWEFAGRTDMNAHAWSLGFTDKLAIAIHLGNKRDELPLVVRTGESIAGSGLPTTIMRTVLTGAHSSLGLVPTPFPPPTLDGDKTPPGSLPD